MNTRVIYWPIHMINIFPVVDYGNGYCFVWTLHGVGCRYLNIAKLLRFSTSKTYIEWCIFVFKKMKYSTYANSVGHCRDRPIRFLFHKMKLLIHCSDGVSGLGHNLSCGWRLYILHYAGWWFVSIFNFQKRENVRIIF